MDDIVALAATTDEGRTVYFLTWGRIQDSVDPSELEAIVLAAAGRHATPGSVVDVRLCVSLQEAAAAPFFYEAFFGFCQQTIPFGRRYDAWRARMDQRMREGYEIASLGPFE